MSIYSGIPVETLQARLIEAQDALHALETGQQTVSVALADGTRVAFTPATVANLRRYISDLLGEITALTGNGRRRKGVYLIGGSGL